MAARNLIVYNGPVFPSDSANTPSACVERDAAGNINIGQLNASALNPSQAIYLPKTATLTATGTIAAVNGSVVRCDATSGNQAQTLPPAASVAGLTLVIKRLDTTGNTLTISANTSELIDGAASITIGSHGHATLFSNGTGWDVIG